ncbi:hypothetical protein HNQ94_002286 [Salirhabdus euzebyi]|uniref:Peptidase M1 membrane alanine aminopeptidase domain-containing protein n=1 Tax=Salirhabdus euzebyi TaxID=394506 RepID=A0A841Q625_9BACI|nr:M1 family metallopeptidase [Salirhabdus euzebyi]MBB6453835.1 hypothetical protein [Salirhabdus euzebyi]
MNRRYVIITAISIFVLLLAIPIYSTFFKTNDPIVEEMRAMGVDTTYYFDLDVDPESKIVTGTASIYALNDTEKDLESIYFHLYPNAFEEVEKNDENWETILGDFPLPGFIEMKEIKIDGETSNYVVKNTILEVPLEWKTNELTKVELAFTLNVPLNNNAISYDQYAMWLGNSLPIKSVYDESGWNTDPYYPIGDPFYNEMANYHVKVKVPKEYQVTNTGLDVSPKIEEDSNIYDITANKVRSFSFAILGNEYDKVESQIGNKTIRTWYRKSIDSMEAVNRFHEVSEKSIAFFSEKYGEYPYEDYDVIATRGFFGGMELPGVSLIQGTYFTDNTDYGVNSVAHEAAHQWWFHVVGSNQIEEPWLDESLTVYSTIRFLKEYYPEVAKDTVSRNLHRVTAIDELKTEEQLVKSAVTSFKTWDTYFSVIYSIGPLMFDRLENEIGEEKMDSILSNYFEKYKYKIATGEDLIQTFVEELGEEAETFFHSWLQNEITNLH